MNARDALWLAINFIIVCIAVALWLPLLKSAGLRLLSHPRVVDWLIRRAQRTPYTPIISPEGLLYMERFWLFNAYQPESSGKGSWLPSIRLHRIHEPDPDRHLHDHPWNARTVILAGGYTEVRHAGMLFDRDAGDTALLKFGEYHRIMFVKPDTWTMFITYRYRGTWGFLVDGHKVPWREYLK